MSWVVPVINKLNTSPHKEISRKLFAGGIFNNALGCGMCVIILSHKQRRKLRKSLQRSFISASAVDGNNWSWKYSASPEFSATPSRRTNFPNKAMRKRCWGIFLQGSDNKVLQNLSCNCWWTIICILIKITLRSKKFQNGETSFSDMFDLSGRVDSVPSCSAYLGSGRAD